MLRMFASESGKLCASLVFLVCLASGCCNHNDLNNDQATKSLIGRECLVVRDTKLPSGDYHRFPSCKIPLPTPLLALERGSVLKVSRIEEWDAIDPAGTIVYAVIENGAQVGKRVVLGELYGYWERVPQRVVIQNQEIGVPGNAWRDLRPLAEIDVGSFYSPILDRNAGKPFSLLAP